MAKYLKVTDSGTVGYHSVEDDFKLPRDGENDTFEFVTEAVARKEHPALFGPDAPAPKSTK